MKGEEEAESSPVLSTKFERSMVARGGGRSEFSYHSGNTVVTIKNRTGMATAADVTAATVLLRDHKSSNIPAKKQNKEDSRRTGRRSTA